MFVGHQDRFTRGEDFGGFGHEVDAAEDDDICLGCRGFAGEVERIADEISNVLDFGALIIVGDDDGVALGAQVIDTSDECVSIHVVFWHDVTGYYSKK